MDKIKKFFAGRGVGYYLTLPALIFCAVALNLYKQNGVSSFSPELNGNAISYIIACLVLCVISFAADTVLGVTGLFSTEKSDLFARVNACLKPVKYIAYLFCLYSFMWFIYSQVTYIANVFVAIDGYTFTSGFKSTVAFFVLSFVFVLLSGALNLWCPWKRKNKNAITEGVE